MVKLVIKCLSASFSRSHRPLGRGDKGAHCVHASILSIRRSCTVLGHKPLVAAAWRLLHLHSARHILSVCCGSCQALVCSACRLVTCARGWVVLVHALQRF